MPNRTFIVRACLDGGVTVGLLVATPACRHGIPTHPRVEPDRQRATALKRLIIGWPVPGLVGRQCRSADATRLPFWIHKMKPSQDLCNRARQAQQTRTERTAGEVAVLLGSRDSDEITKSGKHSIRLLTQQLEGKGA